MTKKAKTNKKSNAPERDNKEIKVQEEALKIRNADGSHVEVEDLNDQAEFYYEQGKYDEAEQLYVQALEIHEKTLGPNHPDTEKVREKLETLRNENARIRTADGPHVEAADLDSLAAFYEENERYEEAERLYRRALAIREKFFGSDHPDVETSLDSLAALYESQRKYTEAEPLFMRALAIREKSPGTDHPDVATSLNNLAAVYDSQGRYKEAEPLYVRSLAIREKALGPDDPYTVEVREKLKILQEENARIRTDKGPHVEAADLDGLAAFYNEHDRYKEAETLCRRALAIREKSFGSDHPDVAISLYNLADLIKISGAKESEMLYIYKRGLAIMEKSLGSDNPELKKYVTKLAEFYHWNNRYTEAEPLYVRALAIMEKSCGPDHPEVTTSLKELARFYNARGRYAEAETLYLRALAICEKSLSPDHPEVAASLKDLAEFYDAQGRYDEAKPLFTRLERIINLQLKKENISDRKYQFKGAGTEEKILRVLPEEILETLVTVKESIAGPSFVIHHESRPTMPIRVKDVYSGGHNSVRAFTLTLIDDRKLWSRIDGYDYLEIQDPPDFQPRTTGPASSNNFNFIFTCQGGIWAPTQPKSYTDGWEIDLERPLRSTWNGSYCKMFCLNYITGELILVKPIAEDSTGKETHSMALGKPEGEYEPEFFAEQRMLRCFFDPEANAVGICTPLVRGYSSKTGWTQTGKQNLSNLYARITPIILALDPKKKLKITTDIDNKDAGNNLTDPISGASGVHEGQDKARI